MTRHFRRPGVVFPPVTPAFCPGRPGFRPGHPGFRPGRVRPRSAPASAQPSHTSALRRGKVAVRPQGVSNPGALRLETAAQARVNFREIGGPWVFGPGGIKKPPRRAA